MDKILVIRLSSLGDVLLTTPALRALKRRFPAAAIEFLTKPAYAPLLENHPAVSAVLRLGGVGGTGLSTLRRKVQREYGLVVDLHRNLRSFFLTAGLSRRKLARVEKGPLRRRLLVHFKWNTLKNAPAVPERNLSAVRGAGAEDDGRGLDFFGGGEAVARAGELFARHGLAPGEPVGLAPGSRWRSKRWPVEKFIDLVRRRPGQKFLILGDASDGAAGRAIVKDSDGRAVNLAGATDIQTSGELLRRCKALVTNDSGLMHLGAAVGVPLVAIFGSTVREFGFFPFRAQAKVLETPLSCRPCAPHGRDNCPRGGSFECLHSISAQTVADPKFLRPPSFSAV